jgi:sugar lactone lactonase YvrE
MSAVPVLRFVLLPGLLLFSLCAELRPAGAEEGVVQLLDARGDGKGHALAAPRGLALDRRGNLYVVGFLSHNVFRVAPDGSVTQLIDASGDGQGHELRKPREVAVDARGNVYVAGEESGQVFRIAPGGAITRILGPEGDGQDRRDHRLARPSHVAVGPQGEVYVAGQSSHNVFRIEPGGAVTCIIDRTGAGQGRRLIRPNALAVDAAGNVYVAGAKTRNVFRRSPDGKVVELFDGKSAPPETPLVFPNDLALDARGNVYVTGNNSGNVLRLAADGTAVEVVPARHEGKVLGGPDAVAVAADGTVYVARVGPYGVWRVPPGGAQVQVLGPEGAAQGRGVLSPRSLLLGPGGHLYVSGMQSQNVLRLAPSALASLGTAD